MRAPTTLENLIHGIEIEHNAVAVALQSALAHAIAAGELLIEVKREIRRGKGKWLPWLAANCPALSPRTASHYVWLAKHRADLSDEIGNVLPISVTQAMQLLKHPLEGREGGRGCGIHEWGDYVPYGGWGCGAWQQPFNTFLEAATRLPQLKPPAPRYVVKAARAGKTPGLTAPTLREAIALLTRYAEALEV